MIRRLAAEGMGTAFLLMTVIGSGIMGEKLSEGNDAIALLANSIATGCALAVLIFVFAPVSGAHFNPVVTLCMAMRGKIAKREAAAYIGVQISCAILGVAAAHLMFGEPVFFVSEKVRSGWPQWFSEFIATFGLLMVIWACVEQNIKAVPLAVAAYITAAYWFTASTSFANPAVTIARCLSNTFAGISPSGVIPFIIAQVCGAVAATMFAGWIFRK